MSIFHVYTKTVQKAEKYWKCIFQKKNFISTENKSETLNTFKNTKSGNYLLKMCIFAAY
jgi:hypothetical protein